MIPVRYDPYRKGYRIGDRFVGSIDELNRWAEQHGYEVHTNT